MSLALLRIVLDTSVLVSAFRSPRGASFQLLQYCREGRYMVLATPTLFLEWESVLMRREQRDIHGLSAMEIADALSGLASIVEPVRIDFQWRPQLGDPNDEFVLEAAINGKADVIVTYNLRDFLPAATRFGIQVMSPASIIGMRSE